ncbi:MAG: peptidoglycan-binding protein, partial [Oscillospiraceae bacterium]|nr:peptidoglycan-binding protein [Oscillospiraceae bacterium]
MPMSALIPYIPEYITVHLGPPGADAPNVTVPFIDYVKNVASSEVYPTWEVSALRANILAIVSFALNRIYLDYYRSRGYPFDITSTTAYDQRYVNGRSTFDSIDRLVDELFDDYIRRQGFIEPLAAKFCNGTTVTCDGLSQWGSQALAQQGYDSVQILKMYYGDDVEIVQNVPAKELAPSYPGRLLRLGEVGTDVARVQFALNRVAQNYPAIPRIPAVDGIFGVQTEQAVRAFQSVFNLAVDGVVGPSTWYELRRLFVAVTRLAELRSEGVRLEILEW